MKTLTDIYTSFIRPIFDYAAPSYHTLLTDKQAESLERLQRATLKTIHGFDLSYNECLERSGIPSLRNRRGELFERFVTKTYESNTFKERWFKEKEKSSYNLRHEEVVVQNFASCERLQNAPIYRFRQLVNNREKKK